LRLLDQECLEHSETDVPAVEELSHLPTAHDRKVSAKQHPVKTRKHTVNPVFISLDEFFHGLHPPIRSGTESVTAFEGLIQNGVGMKDFRQRKVWEKSHELALAIYHTTASFPREETYGRAPQIRRAASSIPSNIAEGCGRHGDAELARFGIIARGSTSELEYQLLLARDLKLLQTNDYETLSQHTVEIKSCSRSWFRS
jgi:four helix bundle protein